MSFINEPVLNIIVVGFHHKKGCQVEHCYPELVPGHPSELPVQWRHLPALALPDGSHNYNADTIFFNLPGLTEPAHTVYGISCFRQIPVEDVVQKTEDMTRSSVQKSVCIVCRAPLYGRLAVKMELVVRAWFLQGDFSQTKLLEDAYQHLNNCPVQTDQILEGLPVQSLVDVWRHKTLLLFKLLLLNRKVLIFGAQAGPVSTTLLTLISLLPHCIEYGLSNSANVVMSRPISPNPPTLDIKMQVTVDSGNEITSDILFNERNQIDELSPKESGNLLEEKDRASQQSFDENILADVVDRQGLSDEGERFHIIGEKYKSQKSINEAQQSPSMARDMSVDGLNNMTYQIDQTECGFPFPIFEDGYLCFPYLSLQYLDLLSDSAVHGFIVGASNVLFKQKKQLFDVIVESNEMRIETSDLLLRKQLALTTEDLRFADHIVRHGLIQGDAWIREQFASYFIYLLRTSLLPETNREMDSFNVNFMTAFKITPAYEKWLNYTNNSKIEPFMNLAPIHPFSGQLSVADMKLKLSHTMSTTEGGRKVTAAVASTGRAVATTSRAVGGALSHARGALTGWWSALTTTTNQPSNASDSSSLGEDNLMPLDTEEAIEQLDNRIENRTITSEGSDPLDKSIEDTSNNINKITVI